MADDTYYSLLEISETATTVEIKSAYHRLIREVHPDLLANAPAYWQHQAEEKSKEINEAYSVLSDREKRRVYDSQLAAYRGSGTTNRRTTSAPPGPSATSAKQRSQTHSRAQSNSGSNTSAKQTARSTSQQHQSASTSASTANPSSQPTPQAPPSKLTMADRFVYAFVGLLAFGAAAGFWNAASIGGDVFDFLLAGILLFAFACLYQRQVSTILGALRVKRPNHQLWATLGTIAFVLLGGKIVFANLQDPAAVEHPPQEITSHNNQAKYTAPSLDRWTVKAPKVRPKKTTSKEGEPAPGVTGVPAGLIEVPIEENKTQNSGSVEIKSENNRIPGKTGEPGEQQRIQLGAFTGKFIGTVHNETANVSSGFGLTVKDSAGNLSGCFAVLAPLVGSGPITGSAIHSEFEFTASSSMGKIIFRGTRSENSISGTYVVKQTSGRLENGTFAASEDGTGDSRSSAEFSNCPPATNPQDLSRLSNADRASIESACSSARLLQGAASYHQCLNMQLEELARNPNAPNLNELSSVDRASIESACSSARLLQGAASYHQCLNMQLEELARDPNVPNLNGLSAVDRASIESACSSARLLQGAASYHRCLKDQLSALGIR